MSIAWAALILWPVVCIVLFKRLKLPTAICVSLIGGNLLLPSGVANDLPVLPPLNKDSIPVLTALALTAIALGDPRQTYPVLPGWLPRNRVVQGLMAFLVLGAFGTVLTNQDMLFYGPRILPGLRVYDAFSMILSLLILALPLVLGRKALASPEGQRVFLTVLVISAVIYCFPALYEIRMSPQLHATVYGFYPHSWFQALRGGGYRPSVFMGHGLELAIFLALAILAAIGLFRTTQDPSRLQWLMLAVFMFAVLILCKSLGALLIVFMLAPFALFCRPRTQLLVAACVSGVVLLYPMMRAADLVPVNRVLSFVEGINPVRAESLDFRLFNEDILLEKARERPLLGWGIWARNRVYDERGVDISITDGFWIVEFGVGGWIRYIGICGLLCMPCIALFYSRRKEIDPLCAIIALLLAAKLFDLIPNTGLPPLIWLMVGSLIGRLEMSLGVPEESMHIEQDGRKRSVGAVKRAPPEAAKPAAATRYRRHFPQSEKRRAAKNVPVPDETAGRPSYRRGKVGPGGRK